MTREFDIALPDGRTLHAYDDGLATDAAATVIWQHGTPQTGGLPEPLRASVETRGIRWISYDRPGYTGSARQPGRTVAHASADVVAIADALGIERFATIGHSGGGPPSLAVAAMHPDRVTAVVSVSGLAPFTGHDDWYDGMFPAGKAELLASVAGEQALRDLLSHSDFDPAMFTPADRESLAAEWSWLDGVVTKALAHGVDGMVDDDLSYVAGWGCDPGTITAPVLLLHGDDDRIVPVSHAMWLAEAIPRSERRVVPGQGHLSILRHMEPTLDWLLEKA